MKTNKLTMILLAGAALAATACQESIKYKDVVFFTGTESSPVTSMYVDGPTSTGITVTSSCKMAADMTVDIDVNGSAVEPYNAAHGTAYKMLPEGSYRLSANNMKIEAGKSVSLPVVFEILSMDDFEDGVQYCAPITITGTSNGMDVLEASRTTYLMINQIITTQGVDLKQNNYISFPTTVNHDDYTNLSACTMEIRVFMNSYYAPGSNPGIASVIGVEENFLLRFGDISCDKNQLQVAGRGASVTSKSHFNTKQWYHLAVVDDGSNMTIYVDGEIEGTVPSDGKPPVNLAWDYCGGFHIGFSERGRLMDGVVTEARVWTRALNPIELENNQCYVDPNSEGLLGYWRLDELDENGKFKDLTGRGHDGVPNRAPSWSSEFKCPIVD